MTGCNLLLLLLDRLGTVQNDEPRSHNDDYSDPDQQSPNSPPPYQYVSTPANAPPVPPRTAVRFVDIIIMLLDSQRMDFS